MSIREWLAQVEGFEPEIRERVMTITCTRWLEGFNKALLESPQPEKLVAENNALLSYTLVQLTQIASRQAVADFFEVLEQKNPFTKVKVP